MTVTEQRVSDDEPDPQIDQVGLNGSQEYARPGVRSGRNAEVGQGAPATWGARFGALLVDWILCVLVSTFFGDPRRDAWLPVLVLIVEYTFFLGFFDQTPGMRLTGVRCVSVADGAPIGVPRALLRGVLLSLFVPALIVDERRRGLHDRAAGSIVVTRAPV